MSANTFNDALERTYEECWRLLQEHEQTLKEPEAKGWDKQAATQNLFQVSAGSRRVLGALLHLDGQIGLRKYPAAITPIVPDPKQAELKLWLWAVQRGLMKQAELDEAITVNGQLAQVVGRIGDNFL